MVLSIYNLCPVLLKTVSPSLSFSGLALRLLSAYFLIMSLTEGEGGHIVFLVRIPFASASSLPSASALASA